VNSRVGDWIQTATGRAFYPLDPDPSEICVEDIAHALSHQCRFSGHCKSFYSVAEHSVRVAYYIEKNYQSGYYTEARGNLHHVPVRDLALWGLLHDASEAYLVDLPRPLKRSPGFGEHYKAAEDRLTAAIVKRFGLLEKEPDCVKIADNVLLVTEARDLMLPPPMPWVESTVKPLDEKIEPWDSKAAGTRFLMAFHRLTTGDR